MQIAVLAPVLKYSGGIAFPSSSSSTKSLITFTLSTFSIINCTNLSEIHSFFLLTEKKILEIINDSGFSHYHTLGDSITKGEFGLQTGDLLVFACAVCFTFHILVIDHF